MRKTFSRRAFMNCLGLAVVSVLFSSCDTNASISSENSEDGIFIYASGNDLKYAFLSHPNKSFTFATCESPIYQAENSILLSSDQKYIYFFSDSYMSASVGDYFFDQRIYSGTLHRVDIENLASSKGDFRPVETIGNDVFINDVQLSPNGIAYTKKGDGFSYSFALYYFNGDTNECIDTNVIGYAVNENENCLYFSSTYLGTSAPLYCVNLSNPQDVVHLVDNYCIIKNGTDRVPATSSEFKGLPSLTDIFCLDERRASLDDILHGSVSGFTQNILCTINPTQGLHELGVFNSMYYIGSAIYYTIESGSSISLYNCVEDRYYESDQNAGTSDEQIQKRNSRRRALKSPDCALPLYILYQYENGTHTVISDNILSCTPVGNALLYSCADNLFRKLDLADYTVEEIKDLLPETVLAPVHCISSAFSSPIHFSYDLCAQYEQVYKSSDIYSTNTCIAFFDSSARELLISPLETNDSSEVSISNTPIQNVHFVYSEQSTDSLYYICGLSSSQLSLYKYQSGSCTGLLQDIAINKIIIWEDGIIAYTTPDKDFVYVDGNGSSSVLGQNITYYTRPIPSTLFYILNSTLYQYQNKKVTELDQNIKSVLCPDCLDISVSHSLMV